MFSYGILHLDVLVLADLQRCTLALYRWRIQLRRPTRNDRWKRQTLRESLSVQLHKDDLDHPPHLCCCFFLLTLMVSRQKIKLFLFEFLSWLVGFYGISAFVGYLTPNPFLYKKSVLRGSLNKSPDFFRVGTFIDSTHMKL